MAAAAAPSITFLDVGHGDSAVIETPAGETWLVDAGGRTQGNPREGERASAPDPGEQAVWRFLLARRIPRLDVVVVTHPHPDHYGGLPALLDRVPIGEVLATARPGDEGWAAVRAALAARGIPVHPPETRTSGGVTLEVLSPTVDARSLPDDNDSSIVLEVSYAGRAVLLTGDIEAASEGALVAAGGLAADVVKVPHHGSANQWGFPAPGVVARWQASGARVLRTDLDGAVTVRVAPDGDLRLSTFRGGSLGLGRNLRPRPADD